MNRKPVSLPGMKMPGLPGTLVLSAIATLMLAPQLTLASLGSAFGAPGIPYRWASTLKQAIGTSYEADSAASPVWFTLTDGIVTEVLYPNVDQAQIGELQLIVTDGRSFYSEQKKDVDSQVSYVDEGMTVHVSGQEKSRRYVIEQDIVTDTAAPVLRIHTTFRRLTPGLRLFVVFRPAMNNSGSDTLGTAESQGLFATRMIPPGATGRESDPVHAALLSSAPWLATSAGYVGFSDGAQELSRNFFLAEQFREAGPGNIALVGELQMNTEMFGTGETGEIGDFSFDMAIGFGGSRSEAQTYASTSLTVPFDRLRSSYEGGWKQYLQKFQGSHSRFMGESLFARRSAQTIKMHEDKKERGAIVASLSAGYRFVWLRDLYHAAMGLLAAGDEQTAVSALHYMYRTQQEDGSWPQNLQVDGAAYGRNLQMDEVAYPILLASQLQNRGVHSLSRQEREAIRKAASFIISHGPATPQDRWEELSGYSPSTIAVEIAALKSASALIDDPGPAAVANRWESMIETWTLVHNGPYGTNYYLRSSVDGNPDEADGEHTVVDAGFLELVRMGIRDADDPRITGTLQIFESPTLGLASYDSAAGSGGSMHYRRYDGDANGAGGYWPLLAGERGIYAVAGHDFERARAQLLSLERSAGTNNLLPFGDTTGPAPHVWTHAEELVLHRSIEDGAVFDAPFRGNIKSNVR